MVLVVLRLPPVNAAAHEQVHHNATDQGVVRTLGEDLQVADDTRNSYGQHDATVTCNNLLSCRKLWTQPAWSQAYGLPVISTGNSVCIA